MNEYGVEEQFKLIIHLTDGSKFNVHGTVSTSELLKVYRSLGANGSRLKFPTAPDRVHLVPGASIFRIEAEGKF